MTDQEQAGRPGRYQRSVSGGVGALIVLVLLVLAFVVFRSVFRDNDVDVAQPVDYLSVVGAAQQAGLPVVYPPSLPEGWTATSVAYDPGPRAAWGVGILTGDGRFVGVRQADQDLDSLLETYVDADATQGDLVSVDGSVAPAWQEWSDAGGDHAYSATVGQTEVLVFGSAPSADLLTIVRSLTDAPVT